MQRKFTYEYLDDSTKHDRAQSMVAPETQQRMNVGIQTIIPPKDYISPVIAASHRLSLLDFPRFLYMPHTILFLVIGLSILLMEAFKSSEESLPFINYFRRYFTICHFIGD